MKQTLKSFLKVLVTSLGYEIARKGNYRSKANFGCLLKHLAENGFKPMTVFDLGAASGTTELYATFPEAKHILFEAIEEHRTALDLLKADYNVEVHLVACGNKAGCTVFNVHPSPDGSSILSKIEGPHRDGTQRTVQIVRIDDVVDVANLAAPILIKADIQGAEVLALQGAEKLLGRTDVMILEARLFESYKSAPLFHDLNNFLNAKGFLLYDIGELLHRPFDNALMSFDAVYVRRDSPLRQNQTWKG